MNVCIIRRSIIRMECIINCFNWYIEYNVLMFFFIEIIILQITSIDFHKTLIVNTIFSLPNVKITFVKIQINITDFIKLIHNVNNIF